MLHRRPTATLVAVLLPLGAALTSCGFDYPTDRVNTIAAGVNNREADVDVLGARVLASADGHGRLIGTLVYNAIQTRNYPVVQAGVLVIVFLFVVTNLIVDLSYSRLDPRIVRRSSSAAPTTTP